ncbi:MAG TPA: hypothetical protein VGO45_00665 [Bacteroidia bacterium]|nr:hypothetical protein [Bacteroidia bacterium]
MRVRFFLLSFFFFATLLLPAQQNEPLNRQFSLPYSESAHLSDSLRVAENQSGSLSAISQASCFRPFIVPISYPAKTKNGSLLYRKLKKENLIIIDDTADKFHVSIDPLMDLDYGKDQARTYAHALTVNTRGVIVRGSIGSHFAFETSVYENQSWQPFYIDSFARTSKVIPGQGRWKTFKQGGFDYSMSSGYISYSLGRHLNIQAGNGKHFVGDGYRSLLLSDNAFNYPYLRITTTFGPFQYTNLYASFMNLTSDTHGPANTERLYQKKSASFQMLSINLHPRIQLGFFQGLIAQGADSTNRQHLDFYYYNPVIGVSALKYGFNDPNHILMGSTLKVKVCSFFTLYAQYMLDGIALSSPGGSIYNRQGFQVGGKLKDLFTIRNLHLQLEYNQVRPYSYAAAGASESYSHYNQPLADPLGANFKEAIAILDYRVKDFFVELKCNYALMGADSIGRYYGQNIFSSDNNAYFGTNPNSTPTLQGVRTTLRIYEFKVGYLVNPAYNLNIMAGILLRDYQNSSINNKTNYIYLGIRTSLSNLYYDF